MEDRKWFNGQIDLSTFAGQKVSFIFKSNGGPNDNRAADWAGWSNPQMTRLVEKALSDYPINFERTKYEYQTKQELSKKMLENFCQVLVRTVWLQKRNRV